MFCPLPWNHISIKNNGLLRICSHAVAVGDVSILKNNGKNLTINELSNDTLNCDTLKQMRLEFLNGRWPAQCARCKLDTEVGINSRNQWESEKQKDTFSIKEAQAITTLNGELLKSNIIDLDIRLGNECNLHCIMCHPGESDKHLKIHKQLTSLDYFEVDGKRYSLENSDFAWSKSDINKIDFDKMRSIKKIFFGGGEPLIIKRHLVILQSLINLGLAPNIELEYSTNLTVNPKNIISLWSHFKFVKICASIDGTSVLNDFIRAPSKWDNVVENLHAFDNTASNIQIFTSTTLGAINFKGFGELMHFLQSQKFKKINRYPDMNAAAHMIYNPDCLSIAALTIDEFKKALDINMSFANEKRIIKKLESISLIFEKQKKKLDSKEEERLRRDLFNRIAVFKNITGINYDL